MSFYENLRDNTAYPLIKRFGTPIVIERTSDTAIWERTYDPITMSFLWTNPSTGATSVTQPEATKQVFSGFAVLTNFEDEAIDGTVIKASDRRLLVTKIPEPKSGDIYTIGTTVCKYVDHKTIAPGNTPVVYIIQARI